jgi:very-short-patch-repair endonuclease
VLRCLPALEAVVVVDSAVRQGKARVSGLRSRLRGPGSVEARRVLGLVDGSSGSLIETIMRLALRQAGLTVRCQVGIDGVGRVDMVIDGWLVIEVDGFAYHSERAQYRLDRARANALAVRGYVLLRFTYEDVMHRLPETVATVLAVHARGR